jgi:hypothetical protein
MGGGTGNGVRNKVIDRFSFSVPGDSTGVGDMLKDGYRIGGSSSTTHGYTVGGNAGAPSHGYMNDIEKFAFGSSANSTLVGTMSGGVLLGSQGGTSSTDYGYWHGGGPPATINKIEKYSYSSDGNSTTVGTLTQNRRDLAGTHH